MSAERQLDFVGTVAGRVVLHLVARKSEVTSQAIVGHCSGESKGVTSTS
jgi:hypothetical protein